MSRKSGWRDVALLSACWGSATTGVVLVASVSSLVGNMLATDKSLATLPIACSWGGTTLFTVVASHLMRHIGRRAGFMAGAAIGMVGAVISAGAIYLASFWLFCAGTALLGGYNAFNNYYRFAAAEAVTAERRSKAISMVMAGGLIAAFIGPLLARLTKELLMPYDFAGVFVGLIGLAFLAVLMLQFVHVPRPTAQEIAGPQRPLGEIVRQPVFLVAAASGGLGYGVMILLMSVTPLSMVQHSHSFADAAFVIQWHVLGMFAPSFVTGHLIRRFGVPQIMLAGALCNVLCIVVATSGTTVAHYWIALTLVGLGWNFLFVGATTLLPQTYTVAERAKAQATNEFLVFGFAGLASFFGGNILYNLGWTVLNLVALPFIAIVSIAVLWLMLRKSPKAATAAAGE
jgi:MFS family permease